MAAIWNRTQKIANNRHLRTIAQLCRAISSPLRHVSTIGKKTCKTAISTLCCHNIVNFGPVAEIGLPVWGTTANFNRFRVLASLLQRRRSTEVNQILQDVWPSPWLVQHIYIFGALAPNGILPGVKFTFRPSLPFSHISALLHGTRVVDISPT